jgi:hypothetical protein
MLLLNGVPEDECCDSRSAVRPVPSIWGLASTFDLCEHDHSANFLMLFVFLFGLECTVKEGKMLQFS